MLAVEGQRLRVRISTVLKWKTRESFETVYSFRAYRATEAKKPSNANEINL